MVRKGNVVSIRISDETHDKWKKAVRKEKARIRNVSEVATISEARLIESLMSEWADEKLKE